MTNHRVVLINVFIYFIMITSCSNNEKNKYSLDYKKNLTEIKSELLLINEFIGIPSEIIIHDNLLIYTDRYEGLLLSVYDIGMDSFKGRYLSQGNGPGEAIPPLRLFSFDQKNQFYVFQPNKRTLSTVSLPDFQLTDLVQLTLKNSWNPKEIKKTKDFFVCTGTNIENGIFGVYDTYLNPIFEDGKYPFDGENKSKMEASRVYDGYLCTNPANNKFAFGCLYSDYLAFYEIKNNKLVVKKEYFSKDANVEFSSNTMQDGAIMFHLIQNDNTVRNYVGSFGNDDYCYMLFSGKTNEEREHNTGENNHIIVFDWNGNYIRTFYSDIEIHYFYVDEMDRIIYAIARGDDGEAKIAKFKF